MQPNAHQRLPLISLRQQLAPFLGGTVFGPSSRKTRHLSSHLSAHTLLSMAGPTEGWQPKAALWPSFPCIYCADQSTPFFAAGRFNGSSSPQTAAALWYTVSPPFPSPGRCPAKRLHRRPFHLPPLFNISPSLAAPSSRSHTQKKPFARTSEGLLIDEKKR